MPSFQFFANIPPSRWKQAVSCVVMVSYRYVMVSYCKNGVALQENVISREGGNIQNGRHSFWGNRPWSSSKVWNPSTSLRGRFPWTRTLPLRSRNIVKHESVLSVLWLTQACGPPYPNHSSVGQARRHYQRSPQILPNFKTELALYETNAMLHSN